MTGTEVRMKRVQYVLGEMLCERGRPPAWVIYEWCNGVAVNKYRGYDRGSYFDLYPYKCLRFAGVPMTRKKIGISEIIRL